MARTVRTSVSVTNEKAMVLFFGSTKADGRGGHASWSNQTASMIMERLGIHQVDPPTVKLQHVQLSFLGDGKMSAIARVMFEDHQSAD
jgi:hypothetical protein